MRWVVRHPLSVAAILLLGTLLSAWQLPKLQIYISPQALTIADSPSRQVHQRAIGTFGSDNIVIFYVSDRDLFAPHRIEALRKAVERINGLRCVSHTRSLFNVPHLREVDEMVLNDPFLAHTPTTPDAVDALRRAALANPFVHDNLLSQDGQTMAINVYIRPEANDPSFDARLTGNLDRVAQELEPLFDEVFHVGAPQVRGSIAERIWSDVRLIGPLSGLLLFLTLALVLRRVSGILIPLFTASISVVWTLGLMAAFGVSINVMTAIVPVLLIVIGSTEDIHLITEYYGGIARGLTRKRAVKLMIRRMGLAISLTFLTSFLGFLAIGFNPIQLVREFAWIAAMGLGIGFLVTVLSVPLLLSILGERRIATRHDSAHTRHHHSSRLVGWVLKRRRWVLGVSAAFVVISIWFGAGVRVNNSIMDYLASDSPVNAQIDTLQRQLAGIETFNILVDGHVQGTFEHVRYLKELQKIQGFIRDIGVFDTSLSFADYVSLVNSVVDDEHRLDLPYEDDVVQTLTLFMNADHIRPYVSDDYSKANILVRHGLSSSAALAKELQALRDFIAHEVDPALDVTITGHSILSNEASDYLASSQAKSLLFMLLMIFAIIALLFLNPRAGLLAVVPNVFLVAGLFGLMGMVGTPLDAGSTMIAAIALGVSVDHTMHLLVRYYSLTRSRVEPVQALQQAAAIEFRPIFAATLSLAAGFLVMALSGFKPVVSFGVLSAFVMLLALYANFILTPALLSYVRLTTLWDVLSVPMRRGLKINCSLFRGMNELQIRHVLSFGNVRTYRAGSSVFDKGEAGRELYVLLSGEVRVCAGGDGGQRLITDRLPGDRIFGAAALVQGVGYICSAEVLRDTRLLVLDWERLQQILRFRPRTGSLLFRNLSVILAGRVVDTAPHPQLR